MATVYCDNCGTSIEESARFCRACGKATPQSEVTTRRFDEQPAYQTPTAHVGPSPTGPAYLAPFELAGVAQTNDLRHKTQRRNIILIVCMLAVMIFALAGLLFFLSSEPGSTAGIPGVPGSVMPPPDVPAAPGVPQPPPGVPAPPNAPAPPVPGQIEGQTRIDSSLIYPGSKQTMSVVDDGKSVLQLQSNDSAKRVTDWYVARLKVAKKVSIAGQAVLQTADLNIVILGGDGGAQVIITREN